MLCGCCAVDAVDDVAVAVLLPSSCVVAIIRDAVVVVAVVGMIDV